jgi:hypothetical protein
VGVSSERVTEARLPTISLNSTFSQEDAMILVRNVFQIKFGRMKEALELWKKEGLKLIPNHTNPRLLTDLSGPFYTLVLEATHKDFADLESSMRESSQAASGGFYQKFTSLVDSGRREVFSIVE